MLRKPKSKEVHVVAFVRINMSFLVLSAGTLYFGWLNGQTAK